MIRVTTEKYSLVPSAGKIRKRLFTFGTHITFGAVSFSKSCLHSIRNLFSRNPCKCLHKSLSQRRSIVEGQKRADQRDSILL
ncbi:hypothetical protein D3C71_1228050 [compost metagenome]